MKASVQVIRNVLSNWGSFFIGALVGFLMMPFLVHRLGDGNYGVWVLILNFTGYLSLLDLGVSASVVKYVAEFKAKEDMDGLSEVCSTAFFVYLASGALAFLLSVVIAYNFIHLFKIPNESLSTARNVTMIVGLHIGLTLPVSFFTGFLRGSQRYDLVAFINLGILPLRTLLIVGFILYGYGLLALAIIHLGCTLLAGLIKAVYIFKNNPTLRLKMNMVSKAKLRMVGNYSVLVFLYYVATRIIFATSPVIIGFSLTAAAVTLYAIPQRLVEDMRVVIMATGVLQPLVSHLDAKGREEEVRNIVMKGTKYSLMIVLPIGFAYILVGDVFISLWMGPKYAIACYSVLVVLTVGAMAHISQFTATQALQGIAKHRATAYVAILEGVANIGLSLVLVRKYGILGVALGTMIPMLLSNLVIIPIYACRTINLSIFMFFKEGFVRPIVAASLFGIILYGFSRFMGIYGWLEFILALVVSVAAYVVLAWFLCLTREERAARRMECVLVVKSTTTGLLSVLSLRGIRSAK